MLHNSYSIRHNVVRDNSQIFFYLGILYETVYLECPLFCEKKFGGKRILWNSVFIP